MSKSPAGDTYYPFFFIQFIFECMYIIRMKQRVDVTILHSCSWQVDEETRGKLVYYYSSYRPEESQVFEWMPVEYSHRNNRQVDNAIEIYER